MSLSQTAILHYNGPGHNGAGALSIPGLKVGDFVLAVYATANNPFSKLQDETSPIFEGNVSVADQLQQQSSTNWSTTTLDIIFARFS